MNEVTANCPSECSNAELEDFASLVLAGGEVAQVGLALRVANAKCLGFLRRDGQIVGVAGLKHPEASYRRRISSKAKVELPEEILPYELGWVFITPSARRKKLSLPLCESVVEAAGSAGVFATSRTNNFAMHSTLVQLGFRRVGSDWSSKQSKESLCLFIKKDAEPYARVPKRNP